MGIGDARRDLPVDQPLRQMPEQVDHPRMRVGVARRHELVQQALDARAHAFKASGRREQGGKEGRAHVSLVIARLSPLAA